MTEIIYLKRKVPRFVKEDLPFILIQSFIVNMPKVFKI